MMQALPSYRGHGVGAPETVKQRQNTFQNFPSLANHQEGIAVQNSRGAYERKFHRADRRTFRNTDVAAKLKEVLNETYDGVASKTKAIAADACSSPAAAENWLAADNPMSLTAFLNAYHSNERFRAHARKLLLLEEDLNPHFQAELSRFINAVRAAP